MLKINSLSELLFFSKNNYQIRELIKESDNNISDIVKKKRNPFYFVFEIYILMTVLVFIIGSIFTFVISLIGTMDLIKLSFFSLFVSILIFYIGFNSIIKIDDYENPRTLSLDMFQDTIKIKENMNKEEFDNLLSLLHSIKPNLEIFLTNNKSYNGFSEHLKDDNDYIVIKVGYDFIFTPILYKPELLENVYYVENLNQHQRYQKGDSKVFENKMKKINFIGNFMKDNLPKFPINMFISTIFGWLLVLSVCNEFNRYSEMQYNNYLVKKEKILYNFKFKNYVVLVNEENYQYEIQLTEKPIEKYDFKNNEKEHYFINLNAEGWYYSGKEEMFFKNNSCCCGKDKVSLRKFLKFRDSEYTKNYKLFGII